MSFSAKPSDNGQYIMVCGIYATSALPLTIDQATELAAALQKALAAPRQKPGKPDCEFCHGRGFVIYTAGGDTRKDQCGCTEKS